MNAFEQAKRDQDRRLDEEWAELQRQPFEPTSGEVLGTVIGGTIGIAIRLGVWVAIAAGLYLVGRAVIE